MSRGRIKTLSLFSGAGGLDIGFHRSGFEIVACVEIESAYCKTLEANAGRGREFGTKIEIICSDIREVDPSRFAGLGIDCIIGGPPCQTFSAAGRRSGGVIGTADNRGQLFEAYSRILAELEPRAFVFENVYGLPGANGGGPWQEILQTFSSLGYNLSAEVVDAADYGVPQHRERLIMVGHKESFEFPLPTNGPDSPTDNDLVGVAEAIADLQERDEQPSEGPGGLYGHLLPRVPAGLNYAFFTAEMGHPEPVFAWRSKFHDLLYKVNPDEPCRTIKAKPGKFTGPFHWNNRHFTSAELKRLQTFPDSYRLVGSDKRVLEQVGNSVPPVLAAAIATSVREQLYTRPSRLTLAPRRPGFRSTFRQRQRERSRKFKEIAQAEIRRLYGTEQEGLSATSPFDESFYFVESGPFDRQVTDKRPNSKKPGRIFRVQVSDQGDHVRIAFRRLGVPTTERRKAWVDISGLSKYLGRIATLRLDAQIADSKDVFSLWWAIERALIARSRFFTLIDIYGHYANRGDCVRVASHYDLDPADPITSSLALFGQSENCGYFLRTREAKTLLAAAGSATKVPRSVAALRSIRFDIRSGETHPILGADRLLCAYPFPLLSQKALVESRVELDQGRLADQTDGSQRTLF